MSTVNSYVYVILIICTIFNILFLNCFPERNGRTTVSIGTLKTIKIFPDCIYRITNYGNPNSYYTSIVKYYKLIYNIIICITAMKRTNCYKHFIITNHCRFPLSAPWIRPLVCFPNRKYQWTTTAMSHGDLNLTLEPNAIST